MKMKIGIVGCGDISNIYLKNLSTLFSNTTVAALYDTHPDRAMQAAQKYAVLQCNTLEELLALPYIGIVLNLTPPHAHYAVCRKIIESGKHVYTEKPLCATFSEAKEIVDLAKKRGVFLCSAPDTFLGAALQTARLLLDHNAIGTPIGASAFLAWNGPEHIHPNPAFFYQNGAGPVMDRGPYYLTALVALLGNVTCVTGMSSTPNAERIVTTAQHFGAHIPVEVPTHSLALLRFSGGALASIMLSFDIQASTLPQIELYGSSGTLVLPDPDLFSGNLLLKTAHDSQFCTIQPTLPYQENSRGIGISDLVNSLEAGTLPRTNSSLTLHVLEIMHAIQNCTNGQSYTMTTSCQRPAPL